MNKLKIVFMGSGAFGLPSLKHLMSRSDVDLSIITQPDRPAGRGLASTPTHVAGSASPTPQVPASLTPAGSASPTPAGRAPVKKYQNVNDPGSIDEIRNMEMDLLIVCDFGQILKPALLAIPKIGPFNIHGSILPAYRGAAPIQRALLEGVGRTGVTFLRVDARCDAGPIVSQSETAVDPNENFGALHARLSRLAVPLLEEFVTQCGSGRLPVARPQDESRATAAPKIRKEELHLLFDRPVTDVHNRIRAFSPSPGAFALWGGRRIKFLKSSLPTAPESVGSASPTPQVPASLTPAGSASPTPQVPASLTPAGSVGVSPDGRCLTIVCAGSSILHIEELQPEGSRVQTAREMLNGHPAIAGSILT